MSCDEIKSNISWYLYNELDEMERRVVEDHVETCQGCAAEMERERAFLARLGKRSEIEPSPGLVAECRHDLMRSIYRADRLRRQSAPTGIGLGDALQRLWLGMGAWRRPAAALCLLAIGFFGGGWVRNGGRNSNPGDATIANISGVNLDPALGQVQISFDEMRNQTLKGRLQDPRIRNMLIYAARSYGNPDVRMDTIEILKQQAEEQEIRDTLLYALENDGNAGVRLKALEGLKQYSKEAAVRRALIQVLTGDNNPGMRVQAVDLLMLAQDQSLVGVLQGVAQKESNNYVRMRCQRALREMNASVESF